MSMRAPPRQARAVAAARGGRDPRVEVDGAVQGLGLLGEATSLGHGVGVQLEGKRGLEAISMLVPVRLTGVQPAGPG
jgi:hypothetical protein